MSEFMTVEEINKRREETRARTERSNMRAERLRLVRETMTEVTVTTAGDLDNPSLPRVRVTLCIPNDRLKDDYFIREQFFIALKNLQGDVKLEANMYTSVSRSV